MASKSRGIKFPVKYLPGIDKLTENVGIKNRTTTFGIMAESMPIIIDSKICHIGRSKKKLRLTFMQEFKLP